MNIFYALTQGYGSITETNLTSFLCYLLSDSNDCKNYFFIEFVKLIEEELNISIIKNILKIESNSIRDISSGFNNKYQFTVEPEKIFDDVRTDIFIRIYDRTKSEDDYIYLIVEAKVNKSAVKSGQLNKQINNFKKTEEYNNKNALIIPILLSPDDNYYNKCYEKEVNNLCWIKWSNTEKSIVKSLRNLIEYEHLAKIDPFDFSTTFIIKSFIDFIEKYFTKNLSINYSVAGIPEQENIEFKLEDKIFILRRFQNNMIRIYDSDDQEINKDVKPILRDIINDYNLNIDIDNKNTQTLGKEIIKKLKETNKESN